MTVWEFITPVLIGITSGQIIRYLIAKEGKKVPDNQMYLKGLLSIIISAVVVTGSIHLLNLAGDTHYMINSAAWLAIFAFFLWRTNALKAAQKADNP